MNEAEKILKKIADYKASRNRRKRENETDAQRYDRIKRELLAKRQAKSKPVRSTSQKSRASQFNCAGLTEDLWQMFAANPAMMMLATPSGRKHEAEWKAAMAGYHAANARLEARLANLAKDSVRGNGGS